MNLNLAVKTAVATGASLGIGLATVQSLIDEGVRVVDADGEPPADPAHRVLVESMGWPRLTAPVHL